MLICLNMLAYSKLNAQNKATDTTLNNINIDSINTSNEKKWLSPNYMYGIDISKYPGDADLFLFENKNYLAFIMFKATEGITTTDSYCTENISKAKSMDLICGAYHLFKCNEDPIAQAKSYLSIYKNLKANDLPPIVKVDDGCISETTNKYELQLKLLDFLDYIKKKTKHKTIIYTDMDFANKYLTDTVFAEYALWIGSFKEKNSPELPDAWRITLWTFWQKAFNYNKRGSFVELDVFNGNFAKLQKFIKESRNQ